MWQKTLPTSTPLSLFDPLDEPTTFSPPCDTCTRCESLFGRQRSKSSIGANSILKLDSTDETIAEIDS